MEPQLKNFIKKELRSFRYFKKNPISPTMNKMETKEKEDPLKLLNKLQTQIQREEQILCSQSKSEFSPLPISSSQNNLLTVPQKEVMDLFLQKQKNCQFFQNLASRCNFGEIQDFQSLESKVGCIPPLFLLTDKEEWNMENFSNYVLTLPYRPNSYQIQKFKIEDEYLLIPHVKMGMFPLTVRSLLAILIELDQQAVLFIFTFFEQVGGKEVIENYLCLIHQLFPEELESDLAICMRIIMKKMKIILYYFIKFREDLGTLLEDNTKFDIDYDENRDCFDTIDHVLLSKLLYVQCLNTHEIFSILYISNDKNRQRLIENVIAEYCWIVRKDLTFAEKIDCNLINILFKTRDFSIFASEKINDFVIFNKKNKKYQCLNSSIN